MRCWKDCRWAPIFVCIIAVLSTGLCIGEESDPAPDSDEMIMGEVIISDACFAAPSPERENLNEEWVEITNLGETIEDFTGWILSDEGNHVYTFPDGFTLDPDASVLVHTGNGDDTTSDLYWNSASPIWNNGGDVATLKDGSGEIVAQYSE
jgi:competence protein ComEC